MGSIKMIVTDMDATLLRDDKTISAYSLEVFAKCRARGLDIVLATARAYRNCLHKGYVQDVSPFGGIYNDGAQVLVGDREIYAKKISHETAIRILGILSEQVACHRIILDSPAGYFVNATNDLGEYGYFPAYHTDFFGQTRGLVYEIAAALNTTDAEAQKLAAMFCSSFDDIRISYAGGDLLLMPAAGVDKMAGVKILADFVGIGLENIVVFGDSLNDLEMIANIPNSVAVANARDEVRSAARWVCGANNEDGVASWLAENILK